VRNHVDEIVARAVTDTILITDDHKEPRSNSTVGTYSAQNSIPASPVSMEESSTDISSSASLKRRRETTWNGSTRSSYVAQQRMVPPPPIQRLDMVSPSSSDSYAIPALGQTAAMPPLHDDAVPQIQRVIPSQGSVRGGIEVTLLGSGFYSGLVAKYGDVKAITTQCWSDSTIVTHIPPAAVPGPVVVSFDGINTANPQIFTYIDDTDMQLIELALQVVGLKMNGKLEDARNIAMRIVGNDNNPSGGSTPNGGHGLANHEQVTLRCIELVTRNEGKMPNWQLRNNEGQTMMHLAASLGYYRVISALISQGARIDLQDVNGMTPLHFAALRGRRRIVKKLLRCHADPFNRTLSDQTVMGIASESVEDLLPYGMTHREYFQLNHGRRSSSTSTLASLVSLTSLTSLTHVNNSELCVSLPPSESDMSSMQISDSEWHDSDGSLDLNDVRKALNARDAAQNAESLPTVVNRPKNRAEHISNYLSQLTVTARNRMNTWDRPNWDEILNYIYPRRHELQNSSKMFRIPLSSSESSSSVQLASASDSDATVAPRNNSHHNNEQKISRMWQYFTNTHDSSSSSPAPPRYEEIYPNNPVDGATVNTAADGDVKEAPEESLEDMEQRYEQQFIQTWVNNQKKLQNDRMLFLFWIPVLVIAIAYMTGRLPFLEYAISSWTAWPIQGLTARPREPLRTVTV
jgi:hypothetical protein